MRDARHLSAVVAIAIATSGCLYEKPLILHDVTPGSGTDDLEGSSSTGDPDDEPSGNPVSDDDPTDESSSGGAEPADDPTSDPASEDTMTTTETGEPIAECGDGTIDANESCDDANDLVGDGCSHCAIDFDHWCDGEPSICASHDQACDPLIGDCVVAGNGCYPLEDGWFCVVDASGPQGAQGDPCDGPNDCDPDLVCIDGATGCTRVCSVDDNAPCSAGMTCQPYYAAGQAPPGYEYIGLCM